MLAYYHPEGKIEGPNSKVHNKRSEYQFVLVSQERNLRVIKAFPVVFFHQTRRTVSYMKIYDMDSELSLKCLAELTFVLKAML